MQIEADATVSKHRVGDDWPFAALAVGLATALAFGLSAAIDAGRFVGSIRP